MSELPFELPLIATDGALMRVTPSPHLRGCSASRGRAPLRRAQTGRPKTTSKARPTAPNTVTLSGNTATVVAQVHEWTKAVARQQTGGRWLDLSPEADKVYNARLSMGPAGTWLVTDMISRFANGSGP